MAVDSLRDTFHKNWVEPDEIGLLLSAQSYRADITRAIKDIKSSTNWLSLQEICNNKISPGPHPKYGSSGHPCLKTRNILGLLASKDDFDWVPVNLAKPMKRFFVHDGNILLNITGAGSIGRVSIYYGNEQPLTNQHIARLDVKEVYESAYICAFLSSWWGERIIEQGISGSTGQLNLVNDHIRALPVLIPDIKVQKYIGDKVRQAERLRERSKKMSEAALSMEDKLIPIKRAEPYTQKSWRATSNLLDEVRLDARYYRPDYVQIVNKALTSHEFIPLGYIVSNIRYGTSVKAEYVLSGCGIPFVRGFNLKRNSIDTDEILDLDKKHSDSVGNNYLQAGEILITRSGTVGVAATVPLSLDGAAYGSYMIGMSIKEDWEPEYIAWFLNSWMGQAQVERLQNGAIQQNINVAELSAIHVWKAKTDKQKLIKDMVLECQQAKEEGIRLTIAAKLLVEALIEGKLSEAELKEAQEDLEQGDSTLDREILGRLTRKGIDCPGEPPLFPNLDALYTALSDLDDIDILDESSRDNSRAANVYALPVRSLPLASETSSDTYQSTEEVPG